MFFGKLKDKLVIFDEFLDEVEVAERVILEMIVMILNIYFHQLNQFCVYF